MKRLAGIVILLLLFSMNAMAGMTGKIAGQVTDAKTGDPLPGVNIILEGTNLGAATDAKGYYFIINIPPGQYTVKASMIGYQIMRQTNVDVIIDRTTTVNFKLEPTVIHGKSVTITATRAVVPLDVSNTQLVVEPQKIAAADYHQITDVLASQPGIAGFGALADKPMIRGSDYRESAFVVDGISMTDQLTSRPFYQIDLSAIKQIKIVTGGFNAEYGDVRSGLVNVVTKDGGSHYTGSMDFRYSPPGQKHFGPMLYGKDSPVVKPFTREDYGAFTGNDIFVGWNKYATEKLKPGDPHYGKPYELLALWLWRHRSLDNLNMLRQLAKEGKVNVDLSKVTDDDAVFEEGNLPDWHGNFTLGGPVPFLKNKVTFFSTYKQEFMQYAARLPKHYHGRYGTLKLTSDLTNSIKLRVNFLYGWQEGTGGGGQGPRITNAITTNAFTPNGAGVFGDVYREMGSANKMWYPDCATAGQQWRYAGGIHLTHTLSPKTFYEVKLSEYLTQFGEIHHIRNTAPIPGNPYHVTHLNYGRIGTEAYADSMANAGAYGWSNWKDWAKINIGGIWYDEAPWGYGPTQWRDVTGEYRMESCNYQRNLSMTRTYDLRWDLTSQVNRNNQVKTGVEITHDLIHGYFDRVDPAVNNGYVYTSMAKPWRGALYVQDKLEFEGMIANLGVRVDWMHQDKMITLDGPVTDKVGGPFSTYLQSGHKDSLNMMPWKTRNVVRISPRFGISHPLSENAKIFFNYGHFYQWPFAYDLYHYQQKINAAYRITDLGNPRLDPPRTIEYEVGYAQNILNRMELKLTGYYKDVNGEYRSARYYYLDGTYYNTQVNGQYKDIRGLEALLDIRRGRYVTGWASANYMVWSEGYYGFDRYYEDPNKESRRVPTSITQPYSRPVYKVDVNFHTPEKFGPKLAGLFPLADFNLNFLYTWRAGEKFTWNPQGIPYVEDNVQWRPYQMTDFRLTKRLFKKWRMEPVFYIDVHNLFNNKNMNYPREYRYNNNVNRVLTGVRGSWTWNGHRWWKHEFLNYMNSLKLDKGDRPGDYPHNGKKTYIKMPAFTPWTFLDRRDIFFGIKINFY